MTIVASPVLGLAKTYRTLGDLRAELQVRMGGGAMGAAGGVNTALINSHLRTAQAILYQEFTWHTLIRYEDQTLGLDQYRIDYPSFMDAERLLQVAVDIGSQAGSNPNWSEVRRGITAQHYNTLDNRAFPKRFEQYEQIEFWPKADQPYTLRLWGMKKLARFTEDGDRTMIDDDLVLLWALATLKADKNHKDAQAVGNQVEKMRVKLRDRSWKQRVFEPHMGLPANDWEPLAKPFVVNR